MHLSHALMAAAAIVVLAPVAAAQPLGFLLKWGTNGSADGHFDEPVGVAVDGGGNVYVADRYNSRVQKFTSAGTYLDQWGVFCYPVGINQPDPHDVAVDGNGYVYVPDLGGDLVQKFMGSGACLFEWYSVVNLSGRFDKPAGVAVDGAGNVYVADFGHDHVHKFAADGTHLTQWGSHGSGDGQFDGPTGLAVDDVGNVYVADSGNHRIQKFGAMSTPVERTSWGRIKAIYR